MKLLIVEDSERLRRSLELGLRRSGFAVHAAADGEEGLSYGLHGNYDVIVLDLMLPRLDGLSVLRKLRRAGNKAAVLILSAKDQVADRVRGLEFGADDYLVKPFAFDELCARVRALGRRRHDLRDPIVEVGHLTIDTARHRVKLCGREVELTPSEYAVLETLVLRRGRVVSKEELLDRLHTGGTYASTNAVEVVVCHLRRKIHVDAAPAVVETRRGYGYIVE